MAFHGKSLCSCRVSSDITFASSPTFMQVIDNARFCNSLAINASRLVSASSEIPIFISLIIFCMAIKSLRCIQNNLLPNLNHIVARERTVDNIDIQPQRAFEIEFEFRQRYE